MSGTRVRVPFRPVHSAQHISMGIASSQEQSEESLSKRLSRPVRLWQALEVPPSPRAIKDHAQSLLLNLFALHLA